MNSVLTKTEIAGIRNSEISCTTCKALCCRLEVMLVDDNDEQVPDEFVTTPSLGFSTMKRGQDGWCEALDRLTMKCTIYELRPFLCREYEVADFDCMLERKKLACTNIPGGVR